MLKTSSVIAFVATANPGEALRFYRDVLGLALAQDSPAAIVFDSKGVMLRISKAPGHVPAPHTILGWRVDDIPAAIHTLTARGVVFERFHGLVQDEIGVWTSPDGAKVAWFKDPDGNVLSLTEFD